MRKKTKNIFLKSKIIIIFIVIISFFLVKNCIWILNSKQEKINKNIEIKKDFSLYKKNLDKIFFKLEKNKTKQEQKYIYEKLIKILEKIKNNKNKDLIDILKKEKIKKNNFIKIKKLKIFRHNTKILKFSRNWNIKKVLDNFIKNNKKNLVSSVFIFKQKENLSKKNINFITKTLKKYNKNILIFIDQEWWLINRYVDFESKNDIEKFFSKNKYSYLKNRFEKITKKDLSIIRTIFPKKYWYFPSLWKIWKTYDLFKDKKTKKIFLEIIAFIRLQTLKNNWINTYWLVADLNRWNPVITWNSRSFSKHLWKYKELANAFLKASRKTWVILYLKHFPGHWDWKIDSHLWILNLYWKEKYLKENMDLFNYFFENWKNLSIWLMVGHMYINKKLEKNFGKIVKKSSFLLTDDLAMAWFKKAKNKKFKNLFFTTNYILKKPHLIIVDTKNIAKIK